ncbi:amino acid adenylation domain-containing protein, partial [Lysinibacillus mangiferihumi]
EERIRYILEDSQPLVVLTDKALPTSLIKPDKSMEINERVRFEGDKIDLTFHEPKNLAYLLYTSGTTGKPKGVMVESQNVTAYVNAFQEEFGITSEDVVLQQASYSFDAFVEEVYPALSNGATVVILKKEELQDIELLVKKLWEENITVMSCSPLLLNEINKHSIPSSVHTIISGGDVLKWEHIDQLVKKAKVYNTYGPTESTVCATYYRCERKVQRIPIGKPIAGYRINILDKHGNLVPIGVPGELCVAGVGVTRGYWKNEALTKQKFITDRFNEEEKVYKTGDQARWLLDGQIEYLGRIDNQVNIRGYRIELNEIESHLLNYEAIDDVVVVARTNDEGDKYLCAYIISEKEWTISDIRKYLANYIPDYMIPAYFVEVESFPVTTHGKLDQKALPNPVLTINSGKKIILPMSETETKI